MTTVFSRERYVANLCAAFFLICEDHFAVELLELQKGGNGSGSTSTALYHTYPKSTMLLLTTHNACNPSRCASRYLATRLTVLLWLIVSDG